MKTSRIDLIRSRMHQSQNQHLSRSHWTSRLSRRHKTLELGMSTRPAVKEDNLDGSCGTNPAT
jgi:hypothetical protein